MKIFHLSDLHIGIKLFNHDLSEDQNYVLQQVVDLAVREKPDAVLIAGDIYDKAIPAADAVALLDRFMVQLCAAVPQATIMLIAGNHDSAPRVNCFRNILSKQNVYMIGLPPMSQDEYIEKVKLQDEYGAVNFYLLPFVKPSTVRAVVNTDADEEGERLSYNEVLHRLLARESLAADERNVLVSHQFYLPSGTAAESVPRADSEVHTVGNIDSVNADVLAPFDYAALGHIHCPMPVGDDRHRYCGTPLAYSVSEAGQKKGVVMVELGAKGTVTTTVLPLTPLREVKIIEGTLEEVVQKACKDYVTVVLTDKVDLDVIDMQERLHAAFPFLLEIRRESQRTADYHAAFTSQEALDPFELCCRFSKDLDEGEKALLQEIVNAVQEVQA